jgi:hypothetical protein
MSTVKKPITLAYVDTLNKRYRIVCTPNDELILERSYQDAMGDLSWVQSHFTSLIDGTLGESQPWGPLLQEFSRTIEGALVFSTFGHLSIPQKYQGFFTSQIKNNMRVEECYRIVQSRSLDFESSVIHLEVAGSFNATILAGVITALALGAASNNNSPS